MFYAIIFGVKLRNYFYKTNLYLYEKLDQRCMKGMSFNTFIRTFFDTKYDEDEIVMDYKDKISSWIKIAVIFFLVYLFVPLFFTDPTIIG